MSAAVRLLWALAVLAFALAPIVLHHSLIGPLLAGSGHRGVAVLSLLGAVAWFVLWLRALPSFQP
ncbi:MAG: hypothetical protein EOP39_23610, partial [Rubrivivax sp.]